MISSPDPNIEWRVSDEPVEYEYAMSAMEERVDQIRAGIAPELIWCLEHPALYTAGASADPAELLEPDRFPVFRTGRGGRHTYHGPGQRVVYVLLDLKKRGADVRAYVHGLEEWIIRTLKTFNVTAERREGRVGVWVPQGPPAADYYREEKIAAIGVRVRKWVTFHGLSLNVDPNLSHFEGIVPCGVAEHGVTSLWALGQTVGLADVDLALQATFNGVFNRSEAA